MVLGQPTGYPVIPDEDMIKLGDYFEQNFDENTELSPRKLQQAVMFMLM